MLDKNIFKQWRAKTDSPVSGKADLSQLALVYPDGIALTEFAPCPASKLNSRLHRPPPYQWSPWSV